MTVYLILVFYVLALPIIFELFSPKGLDRQNDRVAFWGMLAIFLLLALKNDSVGIDTIGYHQQYDLARIARWSSWDFVYFEKGYILLEKVFSKAGVPFQVFLAVVYGVECSSWYFLIRRYSRDARLSVLFFVCYQMFVFSSSGLRQALASGVCIYAYLLFEDERLRRRMLGILLAVFAVTLHRSAYIFGLVLAIRWFSNRSPVVRLWRVPVFLLLALAARRPVLSFTNARLKTVDVSASMSLGGSFLFMGALFLFALFTYYMVYERSGGNEEFDLKKQKEDLLSVRFPFGVLLGYILFSGGPLLRAIMYIVSFVIVYFPSVISKYNQRSRYLIKLFLIIFLIVLFYTDTLAVNQLHICPYRFFWE